MQLTSLFSEWAAEAAGWLSRSGWERVLLRPARLLCLLCTADTILWHPSHTVCGCFVNAQNDEAEPDIPRLSASRWELSVKGALPVGFPYNNALQRWVLFFSPREEGGLLSLCTFADSGSHNTSPVVFTSASRVFRNTYWCVLWK